MNKEPTAKQLGEAYYYAYSKPLSFFRLLFCSFEENAKWYERRVDEYLKNIK